MRAVDYLVFVLLVLGSLVLQSTLLAFFFPFGLIPDLVLILVVSTALIRGSWEGALVGLLAGLGLDIISSGYLGFHALTKLVVGFTFGLAEEKVFKENVLLPAVALFGATLIHEVLFFLLARGFGQMEVSLWWAFRRIILPVAFYNAIVAPFIYRWLLQWYQSRSGHFREGKRI